MGKTSTRRGNDQAAFTLVEIMIVVLIIGILVAISVYSFSIVRQNTQNMLFINDLRVSSAAFEQYNIEHSGQYPPDQLPGLIPVGMVDYLSRMRWDAPSSLGGQWDWDKGQFGFTAGVSIYFNSVNMDARMTVIDRRIDDGDLSTGKFRKRERGYILIIEF